MMIMKLLDLLGDENPDDHEGKWGYVEPDWNGTNLKQMTENTSIGCEQGFTTMSHQLWSYFMVLKLVPISMVM